MSSERTQEDGGTRSSNDNDNMSTRPRPTQSTAENSLVKWMWHQT